jgi:hypothetical protein
MDLGSGIRKKPIPDPGSRGQKGTGSRIQIRNTAKIYFFFQSPSPVEVRELSKIELFVLNKSRFIL